MTTDGDRAAKRLIYVDDKKDSENLHLVETAGNTAPYIALSYCWGQVSSNLKTTRSNIAEHLIGFRYSSLPMTLRNAVDVTREVGIDYLWFDSLCIIQEDN